MHVCLGTGSEFETVVYEKETPGELLGRTRSLVAFLEPSRIQW